MRCQNEVQNQECLLVKKNKFETRITNSHLHKSPGFEWIYLLFLQKLVIIRKLLIRCGTIWAEGFANEKSYIANRAPSFLWQKKSHKFCRVENRDALCRSWTIDELGLRTSITAPHSLQDCITEETMPLVEQTSIVLRKILSLDGLCSYRVVWCASCVCLPHCPIFWVLRHGACSVLCMGAS